MLMMTDSSESPHPAPSTTQLVHDYLVNGDDGDYLAESWESWPQETRDQVTNAFAPGLLLTLALRGEIPKAKRASVADVLRRVDAMAYNLLTPEAFETRRWVYELFGYTPGDVIGERP